MSGRKKLYITLISAGLLAAVYYGYDIMYPNHFVGDMYGLEVLYRVAVLIMIAVPIAIGLLLTVIGRMKKRNKLTMTGNILVGSACIVFIILAGNVFYSRHKDDLKKSYSLKDTGELIQIALKDKDQFAIYEIIARNDTSAVPALCLILLDTNQDDRLRLEAAHALGQLGGDSARVALERALVMPTANAFLTETIRYSLENINNKKGRAE